MSPDDPRLGEVKHNFSYPARTPLAVPQNIDASDTAQPLWYSGNGFAPQHERGECYMAHQSPASQRY